MRSWRQCSKAEITDKSSALNPSYRFSDALSLLEKYEIGFVYVELGMLKFRLACPSCPQQHHKILDMVRRDQRKLSLVVPRSWLLILAMHLEPLEV